MNTLQTFIASLPGGFLHDHKQTAKLRELDRLCPVLVRCGGCRFTCAVQDVEHLIKCITAGGDYVRDVSLPVGSMERAANWQSDCPSQSLASGAVRYTTTDGKTIQRDGRTVGVIRLDGKAHLNHARQAHDRARADHYDDTITEANIGL